ncbi:YfcC family protein [Tenacibaculum sp. IB213877]|uniref:YfcC family protein n=1 Tax=Tenacibaculum sp. IB213877 TaxID=3097351 RepID=UPI002A5A3FD6|nr:YfcC family protein [Tenacibaculum sp. IB213877]MDY0780550.1 YfcC family protein [Tenacibaculum sp. IB213877]
MKNIKFPTPHTILLLIAGFVAILTWLIPAGKFDTLQYQSDAKSFVYASQSDTKTLPATQETLESLNIKIPLEKFTNGDIGKPISVPGTYKKLDPRPQGFMDFIKSPIKGIIESSDIILFVLILGGIIGIMNHIGAFDAGISWLAAALKGKEYWLIIVVTTLISIGGTTFGLAEETIAFYPILIPIFLAAKYDAIVALACVYLGSSIGTMCSTVNPFSVIIASDSAGINWTTGFTGRLIMLIIGVIICIVYIMRYANKVQKDPSKSIVFEEKEMIEGLFGSSTSSTHSLTARFRIILTVFALCFVVMIYGVSRLGWWFEEMTVVFLIGAILIGFLARMKEETFVTEFIKGANDLLGVAFIIGIARGVSVLMDQGLISDTILENASGITSGMPKALFTNVLLFIYSGLSFFIPSSSGMAVLTMPIMSPLADTVGIGREVIVNAYQYGMGLFAFINPTGLILASLAIVKIGYDKWLKFVIPLVIILTLFTMISLTLQVYL